MLLELSYLGVSCMVLSVLLHTVLEPVINMNTTILLLNMNALLSFLLLNNSELMYMVHSLILLLTMPHLDGYIT